jgi:succinylarginine dihydrolase
MKRTFEVNFDGLVGPTHHYGGLSLGNLASTRHKAKISYPKQAALQGLKKMKTLADLGFKQAFLPPLRRPDLSFLRGLGFSGSDHQMIEAAFKVSPELVSACYSASSMWTANAATIAPSADTPDGKVHFIPANLISKLHRMLEASQTSENLKKIFHDERYFVHHEPLPNAEAFGDEGAANHSRLCTSYEQPGVHLFVFGRAAFKQILEPKHYPARQTLEASQAVARLHGLSTDSVVYAQQSPEAIDAGAFHNDVVAVANQNVLFCHEQAYVHQKQVLAELGEKIDLNLIEVSAGQVSLEEAVKTYLFNSQLLTLPSGGMMLVAPSECQESSAVSAYLASAPFEKIQYFDLKQSMQNGGGPACLRLRVVLTEEEMAACHPKYFINDQTYSNLVEWVEKHYREHLSVEDLRDPHLLAETCLALDSLSIMLA